MKKKLILTAVLLSAAGLIAAFLLYQGFIQLNHPSKRLYPVRGVDVSHYQGSIDWRVLSGQGIDFAYIKATEGSSFVDPQFERNWTEASNTELRIGAYHFFSFESSGEAQANHFLKHITKAERMLPPAVDVEPYGVYRGKEALDSRVMSELKVWLAMVEAEMGVKPVVYTVKAYHEQLQEELPGYDLWIRRVYSSPPAEIEWMFWQYSNRMRLDGYPGEERFIDMNVFSGTKEEFACYGS